MKAGTNISHFPYQSLFQQYHFGLYSNFAAGGCTNTLFPQANGQCPTQFTTGAGPGFVSAFDTIYGAYVQDTWQLRPNIVVNYGLRYDYEDGAFRGGHDSRSQRHVLPEQRPYLRPAVRTRTTGSHVWE